MIESRDLRLICGELGEENTTIESLMRMLTKMSDKKAVTLFIGGVVPGASQLDLALKRADKEFQLGVMDKAGTPNFERIRAYIKEGCLNESVDYQADGDYAWCGAFYAFCNSDLHPTIRYKLFPSTYRLFVYARAVPDKNVWPYSRVKLLDGTIISYKEWLDKEPRLVQFPNFNENLYGNHWTSSYVDDSLKGWNWEVLPGDIVVVGEYEKGCYGTHITMCREKALRHLDIIPTVEGNSHGRGPLGDEYEGVVHKDRKFNEVQMVIRPAPQDRDNTVEFLK